MNDLVPTLRRRAFTLLEVVAVTALLGTVLGMAVQMLGVVNRHVHAAEHQAIALRTVENCLERMASLPWDELKTAAIQPALLPDDIVALWPQAKLSGEVTVLDEPLVAKRITLRLSLSEAPRARVARLTTWVYRQPRP
jgi:prepilin-type N-terminal cleavage/methylation domain-containing protein